jgi:hypothetical protein
MNGIDIWDALAEPQRLQILAVVQATANERARDVRDTYAGNFTADSAIEIVGVESLDGSVVVVRYLFHWWEYCPAQSGSDWNYDKYWQGTAHFDGSDLALLHSEVVAVAEIRVTEWEADVGGYSRASSLEDIRARLASSGITR